MSTVYGLHVNSPFDTRAITPVIIIVNEAQEKIIDRAEIAGMLIVRVQKNAKVFYNENIKRGGVYHTYIVLEGSGSSAKIISKISMDKDETCDIVHAVSHMASDSKSEIVTKGIVEDSSSIVYQSDIMAEKKLENITGSQAAKFLELSKFAKVSAIPKLSIHTSSVSCSHSLAITNIRGEDIEYLTTRGLTESESRRTLTKSFLE